MEVHAALNRFGPTSPLLRWCHEGAIRSAREQSPFVNAIQTRGCTEIEPRQAWLRASVAGPQGARGRFSKRTTGTGVCPCGPPSKQGGRLYLLQSGSRTKCPLTVDTLLNLRNGLSPSPPCSRRSSGLRASSKKYATRQRNRVPFWDDADVTSAILRRRGQVLREVEIAPDIFHPVSSDLRAFDGMTMASSTALVRIPLMRATGANGG